VIRPSPPINRQQFLLVVEMMEGTENKAMKMERRDFLKTLAAASAFAATASAQAAGMDRAALVKRHNPILLQADPLSPLSLGNGEFAFTADITGLQTFPEIYEKSMPLCTMSQWQWHTTPLPPALESHSLKLISYDTYGRQVGYATGAEGQNALFNWLRENPHRLHLGRIGLKIAPEEGREVQVGDIDAVNQKLDLWSGRLESSFTVRGKPVLVKTAVHPEMDLLAATIESPLIAEGKIGVRFAFPYGSSGMQAADWKQPSRHRSRLFDEAAGKVKIARTLDQDEYWVAIAWLGAATLAAEGEHSFILNPAKAAGRLEFVILFSPRPAVPHLPNAPSVFNACEKHWQRFWSAGGAVELADSRDARAPELERRVVLSQYLTAIQCSGSMPPQETGLTVNSWYGKFHLEMHWWHAAHFAVWNRLKLLERSLSWYSARLPAAQSLAASQGYSGARWPKMVGPEGRDSPSSIGPLLIWQQPHPIFYAELCYRMHPHRATLERYRQIVHETAAFMHSFAHFDAAANRFVLGPPVIPAQENHPPKETWNPAFELEYWHYGLKIAQLWRERLKMKRNPDWDNVLSRLSSLPARNGVYLAHENCPQTFEQRNSDHPSILGAFGMLPGNKVDRETMRRTLIKVFKEWQWKETWGWDFPLVAMTAARLGEPQMAVDALMMTTPKNRYLPNGHNWQRDNLPCYLPGNGGLLYAIAMMSAGWQGAPRKSAPGFPADGSWTVRWENLIPTF
jgi:protein-glucosylgalactosylhydroxylysine glucosidase